MTNPVSQSPSAQLPVFGSQLVDPQTGNATSLFHRFLAGLYLRTGGATGTDAGDVASVANAALASANAATQSAALAQTTANQAEVVAVDAQVSATAAQAGVNSCVTTIQALRVSSLQTQNNLNDVASKQTSRVNLGVNVFPMTITFDTLSSGLKRFIPIVFGMQVPANWIGMVVFWGINPTSNAVFTISYIRNTIPTVIGTITIVHGGTGIILSPQAATNLVAGDVLMISCPSSADATLAQVGITIPLALT